MEDIKLYLGNETQVSSLRYDVYKEDLDRINKEFPMDKNQVKIDKSYIIKNGECLEVGFFIRNTSNEKIAFENLTLVLKNNKGEIVSKKEFVFDKDQPIPDMSAVPYLIEFKLSDIICYNENEEYDIMFIGVENLSTIRKAELEIEGAENLGYEVEQVIKNFMNELPTLEDGTIDINPFKISKTSVGDIKVILMFRNGHEGNLQLEQFPVSLLLNDKLVIRKVVNAKGNVIPAKKVKLLTVMFTNEEANISNEDLVNINILIQ